jgi:hypothetical protein
MYAFTLKNLQTPTPTSTKNKQQKISKVHSSTKSPYFKINNSIICPKIIYIVMKYIRKEILLMVVKIKVNKLWVAVSFILVISGSFTFIFASLFNDDYFFY